MSLKPLESLHLVSVKTEVSDKMVGQQARPLVQSAHDVPRRAHAGHQDHQRVLDVRLVQRVLEQVVACLSVALAVRYPNTQLEGFFKPKAGQPKLTSPDKSWSHAYRLCSHP